MTNKNKQEDNSQQFNCIKDATLLTSAKDGSADKNQFKESSFEKQLKEQFAEAVGKNFDELLQEKFNQGYSQRTKEVLDILDKKRKEHTHYDISNKLSFHTLHDDCYLCLLNKSIEEIKHSLKKEGVEE